MVEETVWITEPELTREVWPEEKIVDFSAGADGYHRVATVKLKDEHICTWEIHQIVPFEAPEEFPEESTVE